ncbi:MAG TPA: PEP-CTERM sorting domain-containing protein [Methylotenera sp.]|nr:PEP-CTERM sorting domain-containing protein [Methylotenera sp.]
MASLKLKAWIVMAGFALSPLTIHAAVNKDLSAKNVNNRSYNFISIGKVSSSFSDYISRSLFGTRQLADGLNNEKKNIYSASFSHLVPNMVNMINYQTFSNFTSEPLANGLENISMVNYGTNNSSSFVNFVNTPSAFRSMSEPKTYGMILAGLGLMAFVARRRKVGQLHY